MKEKREGLKRRSACSPLSRYHDHDDDFVIIFLVFDNCNHELITMSFSFQFPNSVCQSSTTGRNGTCYTTSECTAKGSGSKSMLKIWMIFSDDAKGSDSKSVLIMIWMTIIFSDDDPSDDTNSQQWY